MLKELRIRNFAVIDDSEITFGSGLDVLLGETGAGKSIIVEALGLLAGTKSAFGKIRDESRNAVIEGTFSFDDSYLKAHPGLLDFAEGGEGEFIVSRVMTPQKTSKARVNGVTVSLGELKELFGRAVDIHSQGANYALFDEKTHLAYLDRFDPEGRIAPLKNAYRTAYEEARATAKALDDLREGIKGEDREYLEYQIAEIERYGLQPHEIEDLEDEIRASENYEDIRERMSELQRLAADESDGALLSRLGDVRRALRALESSPLAEEAVAALERAVEFSDALDSLIDAYEGLDYDADRIERINERLFNLSGLRHRYGEKTADILAALEDYKRRLSTIDSYEIDRERLKAEAERARLRAEELAKELSDARSKSAAELAAGVNREMAALGLLDGGFSVGLSPAELGPEGCDRAVFMLALNRGTRSQPLKEAASGGENSRLMLALKALFNRLEPYPTIVFDEIDAGISGKIASKVGQKIRSMAEASQIILITHLPQVAAGADTFHVVSKADVAGQTVSAIRPIAKEEAVAEIARMMSGETITDAALAAARELFKQVG